MKLADSLHRIGSGLVNSYLVEDVGRIVIVDAGMAGNWRELPAELAAMGRSLDDVAAIVLTHGDPDHIGFAERLRVERGVDVWVHEADAPRARGEVGKSVPWGPIRVRPLLGFLAYGATHGGLRSKPVAVVRTFADGDVLDLPGGPRILALPGHTPGSVAVHLPSLGALFMGDAMTTRSVTTGIEGPALGPFTMSPDLALASLDRLQGIDAPWLLPGHGGPWTGGVPEAVRRIRASASGGAAVRGG